MSGMKMAKPSEKDIEHGGKLLQILNAIDGRFGGPHPTAEGPEDLLEFLEREGVDFDEDNTEHLQALYNSLAALLRTSPSFHYRIIAGMCYVIMWDKNKIVDPDSDTLDLHPDLKVQFQERVAPWMQECFGPKISSDTSERNQRFLEEALELVQACDMPANEAHQLVDYVYGRAVGEKAQEVGGVMVTLAALCLAQGMDMHQAAETELARIWTKVEQIREKQKSKPALSPLPGVYPERQS